MLSVGLQAAMTERRLKCAMAMGVLWQSQDLQSILPTSLCPFKQFACSIEPEAYIVDDNTLPTLTQTLCSLPNHLCAHGADQHSTAAVSGQCIRSSASHFESLLSTCSNGIRSPCPFSPAEPMPTCYLPFRTDTYQQYLDRRFGHNATMLYTVVDTNISTTLWPTPPTLQTSEFPLRARVTGQC